MNCLMQQTFLYGGIDKYNLHVISNDGNTMEYENIFSTYFDLQNIRYYKLMVFVSHCTDGQVLHSFEYIEFSYQYQDKYVPIDNNTVTL